MWGCSQNWNPQRKVARGCECGRLCGGVLPTHPCVEENVSYSLLPVHP